MKIHFLKHANTSKMLRTYLRTRVTFAHARASFKPSEQFCTFISIHMKQQCGAGGIVIACCVAFLLLCVASVLLYDYCIWKRYMQRWRAKEEDLLLLEDAPSFPIDFVLTWGGSTEAQQQTVSNRPDGAALHLSITSVRRFAPWARCIWVVTQRPQVPPRLDEYAAINGVPVVVVHHDDMRQRYIARVRDVDIFNVHAIETDLHRIRGLAEHFVYGSDDMCLGNDVFPRDFFTRTGSPLHTLVPQITHPGNTCFSALRVLRGIVVKPAVLNVFVFGHTHTHLALTVAGCAAAETRFAKWYHNTRCRSFPNNTLDLPPVSYAVYYGLHTGKASLRIVTESMRYPRAAHGRAAISPDTFIRNKPRLVAANVSVALTLARLQLPPPPRIVKETVLMVVAHPDDETIFGGTDLFLSSRVHVVCMTNANNAVRVKELQRVAAGLCTAAGPSVTVQLLTWCTATASRDAVLQAVTSQHQAALLRFTRVVSHASDGEYGHPQHKATHAIARDVAVRLGVPFESFIERRDAVARGHEQALESIKEHVFAARDRALRIYKSQNIRRYSAWSTRYLPYAEK